MSELIDRQAAIDSIRASTSKYTGFMEMEMYTDDDAVEAIEAVPPAPLWHRAEEPPEEEGRYWFAVRFDGHWIFDAAWYTHDISTVIEVPCCEQVGGFYKGNTEVHPDYWMPIEPPKEEEHGN